MSIEYTYEVIAVDAAAKCMEVVYTSTGRQTMHIGARLPFVGESVESVISMYAPVAYWQEQETPVSDVAVGLAGSVAAEQPQVATLETSKRDKLAQIAKWRYEREISGVTVNGVKVSTDRESQAALNGAFTSMSQGFISSVEWKTSTGSFVTLGLEAITQIAQAVAVHVKTSFSLEKEYVDQVNAADSIEAVNSIVPETVFQV